VTKNKTQKIVVAVTMKELVLVPSMFSVEANASVNPPLRPACIKMMMASMTQTIP
jgi:uncharacterized protein YneF (UPF0154 family)